MVPVRGLLYGRCVAGAVGVAGAWFILSLFNQSDVNKHSRDSRITIAGIHLEQRSVTPF